MKKNIPFSLKLIVIEMIDCSFKEKKLKSTLCVDVNSFSKFPNFNIKKIRCNIEDHLDNGKLVECQLEVLASIYNT